MTTSNDVENFIIMIRQGIDVKSLVQNMTDQKKEAMQKAYDTIYFEEKKEQSQEKQNPNLSEAEWLRDFNRKYINSILNKS